MTTESIPDRGPLVLLADDDATTRLLSTSVLRSAGFEVVAVEDGTSALRALSERDPGIVMLDVEMPGLDGFEVCRAIRRGERHRDVPVVMLTGCDDAESVDRAYDAGATDFITKPVTWAMLPHRLRHLIQSNDHLAALRASEQRNRALLAAFPDWIFIVGDDGVIIEDLSQADAVQLRNCAGSRLADLLPAETAIQAHECLRATLSQRLTQSYEYDSPADGRSFEGRMVFHTDRSVLNIVRDITSRKRAEARIQHLAYYDQLTGLPNRQQFLRELRRAIRQTRRTGRLVAVVYIDLDQFKRINDTLGHTVGDALLKSVSTRLEGCLRAGDHVARAELPSGCAVQIARLGGDEFVALITDVKARTDVDVVAQRVLDALSAPFTHEDRRLVITPSIGIAVYPEHGRAVEQLLMNADAAMYQAKAAGRNRLCFYSSDMNAQSLQRLELEGDLRQAVADGALQLYYQPKVDLATGQFVGVEALLRWHHARRGWVSPAEFVPLAEETGLMTGIGNWVLETACRQVKAWEQAGVHMPHVAVNVSGQQFMQGAIRDSVLRKVWEAGIRPEAVELEITESLMLEDAESNVECMRLLSEAGFSLAVDDFGTGYSSLSYLKKFPIDVLKIDRTFVRDLHTDPDDAAICAAILAMAHKLGLRVVAEGVENEEQLDFLKRNGCDMAQGFLLGRPMPAAELTPLLLGRGAITERRQA